MSSTVIIALRCHWCSKQKPPTDLMHISSGQLMCRHCYEWHQSALHLLSAGELPPGCQLCETPMHVLNDLHPGATNRVYLIPIDGIYAVACPACKEAYCRKRADLYKGTAFGEELKL